MRHWQDRKWVLIRRESKQVWVLVRDLSSLGLRKLAKALQGLFTHAFSTLGFVTLVIRLSPSFRSGEGTCHGDLFPAFRETEETRRALPALADSQVTLAQNHRFATWTGVGHPALGSSSALLTFSSGLFHRRALPHCIIDVYIQLIHSFNKTWFNSFFMPGTVLGDARTNLERSSHLERIESKVELTATRWRKPSYWEGHCR